MPHARPLAAALATISLVAALMPVSALAQTASPLGPPEATPNPVALETPAGDGTAIRVKTELGDIVIALFDQSAPVASENFLNLAEAGFYDGVGFHRAVPGFVLQGGDPTGTGAGGPGYTIPDEEVVGRYGRGIVAMARSSLPNSQGSQFFIVLDDDARGSLEANGMYTIFGRVVEGMDVVDAIVAAREPSNQIPDPVRIISASVEQVALPPEPTPEPTPEPPTPSELAASELAASDLAATVPAEIVGYAMETHASGVVELVQQLDLSELALVAETYGTDLSHFAIAQSVGGDDGGFLNLAVVSVPGVPGEAILDFAIGLLPTDDSTTITTETIAGREVTHVQPDSGYAAYVFASDDAVWFVVSSLEDVSPVVEALP
jgi:cyclophilin family peptidyl-prolyl cis-trans isomerase